MIAEAGGGFEERFGCGAAFDEVIDGGLRGTEAIGGLDGFGGLDFVFALGNVRDDACVNGGDIAAGNGRGFHDAGFDQATDVVFGGGDVFHTFGNGPAVGSGFEVPLRGRETPGSVEDVFLGGLEIGEGLIFLGWGDILGPRGVREEERTNERESDTGFSEHFESSLPYLNYREAAECLW